MSANQLNVAPRYVADPTTARARVVAQWRVVLVAAMLSLALGAVLYEGWGERSQMSPAVRIRGSSHPRPRASSHARGLSSLPLAAQGPVSETLGADGPAYRVRAFKGGFAASSPTQGFALHFDRSGVSLSSGPAHARLSLRAVGYGDSLNVLGQVAPSGKSNRVVYVHPGLSEWFANGPLGLEQGFTIARAPSGDPVGPLTLSLALSGNTHPSLGSGGESVTLNRSGRPVLRYSGLNVTDARGRVLQSWLQLHAGQILLRVDASRARYPLRIDPFIQQGEKLTASGESGSGQFGESVALSAHAETLLVGGPNDNGGIGAAWVFTRSGPTTWTQQGSKLTGSGESGSGQFGASVALSANGETALVGGHSDSDSLGAAWVFTRSGTTWTQQGSKLTGKEEVGDGDFGTSVALASKEGNYALIGGPANKEGIGAAWVFLRMGTKWTQQALLSGKEETGEGEFGKSVALSTEGTYAVIGGPENNENVGAGWVFTRSGTTWAQQGTKLTGSSESGSGRFGESVALSASGETALMGGPLDNGAIGGAWVFTRSGSTWNQQGPKLAGSSESGGGNFGSSVSLSETGSSALIGGRADNSGVGAAWVFTRSGTTWTQQGSKLTGSGYSGAGSSFGWGVALSADGYTALVGGPFDNGGVGAAWLFMNVPPPNVTSITPISGPTAGGTPLTIKGTGFVAGATVTIGGAAASVKIESETEIKATTTATTAGADEVVVTDTNGTSTGGPSYTYVPPPTVTSVTPAFGSTAGEEAVTIDGTGFVTGASVTIGNAATSVKVESPTEIKAMTSATTAGMYEVVVSDVGGFSSMGPFYTYVTPPTVASISPIAGPIAGGTPVKIKGSGFLSGATVTIGNAATSVNVISETEITATTSAGNTGSEEVVVTDANGTSTGGPFYAYGTYGAAWGDDEVGQLGNDGEAYFSDVPVAVSGLREVTAVSAGGGHSLALLSNGTVMAWGDNAQGQLGNGTTTSSDVPVPVSGLSGVVAIAAGGLHSLALLSNGTVMAWGGDEVGQLGDGMSTSGEGESITGSDVPVAVRGLSEAVVAISAGGRHSLALLRGGTVMAWGADAEGQLGNETTTGPEKCLEAALEEEEPCSTTPVAVDHLSGVTAISAGDFDSLALLSNGTVMAWGGNEAGQLGIGPAITSEAETTTNTDVPVALNGLSGVTAISAGGLHSLALLSNGTVMAWGDDESGQLGVPPLIFIEEGEPEIAPGYPMPVAVSGLSGVTAISAGGRHSLALLSNGTLMSWGGNEAGELGNGSATQSAEEEETDPGSETPHVINGVSGVSAISAGQEHNLAVAQPLTVTPPPIVTSIVPSSGPIAGGTTVTITGSGFLAGATVTIGSAATSVDVVSETEITATTAATAVGSDEVVVRDSNGTSAGGPSYSYVAAAPTVETKAASSIAGTSATLNATANPNGADVSECRLEYGTTNSYGSSAPCTPSPGSGVSPVAVFASVTGLTVDTAYHFRICATNPGGTSCGGDETFTTPAPFGQANEQAYLATPTICMTTPVNKDEPLNENGINFGPSQSKLVFDASSGHLLCKGPGEREGEEIAFEAAPSGSLRVMGYKNSEIVIAKEDHYYRNAYPSGKLADNEKMPVFAFGPLTLTSEPPSKASPTACETIPSGFVENTGAGGAGETLRFRAYNCSNAGCPPGQVEFPPGSGKKVEKEFVVFPGPEVPGVDSPGTATYDGGSLPWPSVLTEAETGKVRTESKGVVLVLGCVASKTAG